MKGKVYIASGKERREMSTGADDMVNITGQKITWILIRKL